MRRILPCVLCLLVIMPVAAAPVPEPELDAVLRDLLDWLPGRYDSLPQLDAEARFGIRVSARHARQLRRFRLLEPGEAGDLALYSEVLAADGLAPSRALVFSLRPDPRRGAVVLSSRTARLRDESAPPRSIADLELDEPSGADCEFLWRRHGEQLQGTLSNAGADSASCDIVDPDTGRMLRWQAAWVLTADQLWIREHGHQLQPGEAEATAVRIRGREDRSFDRLYKARLYRCTILLTDGSRQRFDLHDRGGEATVVFGDWPQPSSLSLLRGLYAARDGVGLEQRLRLAVGPVNALEPGAVVIANPRVDVISMSGSAGRIACAPAPPQESADEQ